MEYQSYTECPRRFHRILEVPSEVDNQMLDLEISSDFLTQQKQTQVNARAGVENEYRIRCKSAWFSENCTHG